MYTLALCALASAAFAAPLEEGVVKVPINRDNHIVARTDGFLDTNWFFGNLKYTLQKYGQSGSGLLIDVPGILGKRAVANEPLKDFASGGVDDLYYGNVVTGTSSKQTFTVDFDTGSADFFVPGPKCGNQCSGNTRYNQKGVDQNRQTSVTYGSGSITGEDYFDTVSVAGLAAPKTNLISLTKAKGFKGTPSEGLMGMAFSTIANSGQSTYFENLIKAGKVSKNEFSFYLGRASDGTGSKSELTLGGADGKKYSGSMTKVPVTKKGYWQVLLQNVFVGSQGDGGASGQAAIDTGTTLVIAPTNEIVTLAARIPGSQVVSLGGGQTGFTFSCNSPPNISFQFSGKKFAVNTKDISLGKVNVGLAGLLGIDAGSTCLASIIGADLTGTGLSYVVGDVFLKNWYSTYSYSGPAVYFAKAV